MRASHECRTKNKSPKVRWPNEATARWWITNAPSMLTNGMVAYTCSRCGYAHIGHPRSRRVYRTPPVAVRR